MEKDHLFVYGTLLDDANEFGTYLKNNCTLFAPGKFKGRLYDIGEYPGAVVDEKADSYVYGSIYLINNTIEVLKQLDDYEGFGPEQEQPNLFVREIVEADSDKGIVNCWCYFYNLPVDGLRLIDPGDYLSYLDNKL